MRRQSPTTSERSKVRIFFVDADLAPGDMQELTHALTSAIRPTHVVTRVGPTQRLAPPSIDADGNGAPPEVDAEVVDETVDETPAPKAAGKKRTYPKPEVVDIDMNAGGKPFEEFWKEKGPTSHRAKYLVAAAWLHDYAKITAITANHVYTCYKIADWTFDVSDPSVTLRQLKKDGAGTMKDGAFSINHVGLAEVQKMKASA